jgi:hypothetical protein
MNDRELLEAAAKAAGLYYHGARVGRDYESCYVSMTGNTDDWFIWSPLTDYGDALRLAVKLGLVVDCSRPSAAPPFHRHDGPLLGFSDPYAATRRAIVRAAAAMAEKEKA